LSYNPYQLPSSSTGEGAISYLSAIRNHKYLVAATALLGLIGAIVWLQLRTPTYEASAQVLVNAIQGQEEGPLTGIPVLHEAVDPSRTVQTAASLVESREAAERTAEKLGRTPSSVLSSIQVQPEGESSILAVTGSAEHAEEAATLANVFAEESMAVRDETVNAYIAEAITKTEGQIAAAPQGNSKEELEVTLANLEGKQGQGDPTLSIAEQATPPGSASGASAKLVIILSLLCGIAVGCAASVLLELTNRNVRDEEDVQSLWPLPVLARVPKTPRSRLGPRLEGPPAVQESFRGLAVQFDRASASRTILVTSPSSGDGKTTASVSLARQLAGDGHSVILLDFDLRKPEVGRTLGLRGTNSLDLLSGPDTPPLEELLVAVPAIPNLRVFTSMSLGDPSPVGMIAGKLLRLLGEAKEAASFVVIDTPPVGEVSDALRWAHVADDVLVVTRLGNSDRTTVTTMRDTFENLGVPARGLVVIGSTQRVNSGYFDYVSADPAERGRDSKRPRVPADPAS
jgi:Mrp family chromosome partitioning ATPase